MNTFTPWTLFVDIGIISSLLLIGKLMRVKIKWVQQLFIPPSLLAGFIGLALGPHGLDVLPLSSQTGTYAGILIAFIFGALPLTSQKTKGDTLCTGIDVVQRSLFLVPHDGTRCHHFHGSVG